MHITDKLIENILATKNPSVIGLDPDLAKIPACYKTAVEGNSLESAAEVIYAFNRDIIDTVAPFVPAVKPQMAFYEQYGSHGVAVFEKTVAYARSKGLVVIEDGKRNDIGNTARAYANGHLGEVELPNGSRAPSFDVDFLTVTPFLGSESLRPCEEVCRRGCKGIFILVKTSNPGSGEIQDVVTEGGLTVSQRLARRVAEAGEDCVGDYGYSSIGAVVGATYPREAVELRKLMPKSFFLVPGFGAQGGGIGDVLPCFNPDGLGALVNSSRGALYAHMSDEERLNCTRSEYLSRVKAYVLQMKTSLYEELKRVCVAMRY